LRFVAQQQKAATKESKAVSFVNTSDGFRADQISQAPHFTKNILV
jgi:hypothetical protein